MKKLVCLTMMVMFGLFLGACAKASPQAIEEMINPGDKVGDFLITTGEGRDVLYPFDYSDNCADKGDKVTYICQSKVGQNINITMGLYDDAISNTPTQRLDDLWSGFNYQLSIEGRAVNLEAFGYIEVEHPAFGVMRFWNVVITTDKPGNITTQDSGTVDDKPYKSVTQWIFKTP